MMNYFAVLSLIFGILLIGTRVLIHLFGEAWNDFELKIAYTEKQPRWVWYIAFLGVLLIGYTWYQYVITDIPYSIIITIIITITLIKTSQVLFNYAQFRAFAARLLTQDRKTLLALNSIIVILGLGLLLLGAFVY